MTNSRKGREQDRTRVAGSQEHEVRYEAGKKNVSKSTSKDAIREVGNSRSDLERKLDGNK